MTRPSDMLEQLVGIKLIRSIQRLFPGTTRNRGAAEAAGAVLCFIDADCIPAPDWIANIWKTRPDKNRIVVGGAITNGTPDSAVGTAEYFSELSGFLPLHVMKSVTFLPSANFAVGSEAFCEVGGYRDFEKGSDVTFGKDCREHGIQPFFHPEIVVAHMNRTDLSGFLRNQEKLGWGMGNNRVLYNLKGSWLTRFPAAWPLVPAARALRILWRGMRDGRGQRGQLPKAVPAVLLGSVCYGIGFARGARDGKAALDDSHKTGKPRVLINIAGRAGMSAYRGGAIEKIVANQANALAAHAAVTMFGDLSPLDAGVRSVKFDGTMALSWKQLPKSLLSVARGLPAMARIDADVVISTHSRNLLLSLIFASLKRVPLVAWETDHDPWVPADGMLKRVYRKAVARADLVVTESSEQARRMALSGIDSTRLRIIYLSVDTDKYVPGDAGGASPYLLYVAKFLPRKNHALLIEAFKILARSRPELRLVLVGPASGAYSKSTTRRGSDCHLEALSLIREAGLKDQVTILERVPEEELVRFYQECELFIFPSREEGFGLTVLEAMSCGCTVVANDVEPVREVVGEGGVLMQMDDADGLADTLAELLDDKSRRESLGAAARERAVGIFGPESIHEQFYHEIDELLRARPQARRRGRTSPHGRTR